MLVDVVKKVEGMVVEVIKNKEGIGGGSCQEGGWDGGWGWKEGGGYSGGFQQEASSDDVEDMSSIFHLLWFLVVQSNNILYIFLLANITYYYYQLLAIYKGLFTIKSKIVQSTSFYLLNIVELIVCGKIIKRIYRLHLYQNNQHLFIHTRVRV